MVTHEGGKVSFDGGPEIAIAALCSAVECRQMIGYCIACGHQQDGCEPDAIQYACLNCGELCVYGAEELVLRITPEDDMWAF
jgi:hypothetical protein